MSTISPCRNDPDAPRFAIGIPHWGWFLLVTVVLVAAVIGFSMWLPWQRERQLIPEIEGLGGKVVRTETVLPGWLNQFSVPFWGRKFKVFPRVITVYLPVDALTDAHVSRLSRLKVLHELWLNDTVVTDTQRDELLKALPYCEIRH